MLSSSSLPFPAQAVGTSSPAQQITLTNSGAFNLQITRVQTSGDFSQTNTCGASVLIGLSCTITVIYNPTSVGAGSGTLTITNNGANSPQTVAITGTGVAANMGLGVPSGGSVSASLSAGQSAMYTLSVGGAGLSGTASLSCSGAPTGASCSVPATIAFNGTAGTNFTVSVTTPLHALAGCIRTNSNPCLGCGP